MSPKQPVDPETLKIPAFLRKKAIVSQAKQQLILTALDRKQAGLPPNSKAATGKIKRANPLLETIEKIRAAKQQKEAGRKKLRDENVEIALSSARSQGKIRKTQAVAFIPKNMPQIGTVTDYWDRIGVAGIKLTSALHKNNFILIENEDGLFKQAALEMQIDRKNVLEAPAGAHIGLKVEKRAALNGKVYKLV